MSTTVEEDVERDVGLDSDISMFSCETCESKSLDNIGFGMVALNSCPILLSESRASSKFGPDKKLVFINCLYETQRVTQSAGLREPGTKLNVMGHFSHALVRV